MFYIKADKNIWLISNIISRESMFATAISREMRHRGVGHPNRRQETVRRHGCTSKNRNQIHLSTGGWGSGEYKDDKTKETLEMQTFEWEEEKDRQVSQEERSRNHILLFKSYDFETDSDRTWTMSGLNVFVKEININLFSSLPYLLLLLSPCVSS